MGINSNRTRMTNKITQALIESVAVLAVALAIIGSILFAFSNSAQAESLPEGETSAFAVYAGTVTEVDEKAGTFGLVTKNDVTVLISVDDATAFVGGTFTNVDPGDKVVASGTLDRQHHTLAATKVSIDTVATLKPVAKNWTNWMKELSFFKWFGMESALASN